MNHDVAAYEVSSAISNFLVQSRKFTVLDRSFKGFTEAERNTLETSENMPVKELAKLGQELFADMILVGNLNSIRLRKAERKMKTSDRVLEYLAGNIATNIRIIDTATGQIKFSSSLRMNPKDLDLSLSSDIFTKIISKKPDLNFIESHHFDQNEKLLEKLNDDLEKAVFSEEYETAAKIRDQINEIKSEQTK